MSYTTRMSSTASSQLIRICKERPWFTVHLPTPPPYVCARVRTGEAARATHNCFVILPPSSPPNPTHHLPHPSTASWMEEKEELYLGERSRQIHEKVLSSSWVASKSPAGPVRLDTKLSLPGLPDWTPTIHSRYHLAPVRISRAWPGARGLYLESFPRLSYDIWRWWTVRGRVKEAKGKGHYWPARKDSSVPAAHRGSGAYGGSRKQITCLSFVILHLDDRYIAAV